MQERAELDLTELVEVYLSDHIEFEIILSFTWRKS